MIGNSQRATRVDFAIRPGADGFRGRLSRFTLDQQQPHWMDMNLPSHSDSTPVGMKVAEAVAIRLESGVTLAYGHRDYCGIGLRFVDGEYIYGEVSDGLLPSTKELQEWTAVPAAMERRVFSNRTYFVDWLAGQSDASLSGSELSNAWLVGNQRLSKRRLIAFAHGAPVPHTG